MSADVELTGDVAAMLGDPWSLKAIEDVAGYLRGQMIDAPATQRPRFSSQYLVALRLLRAEQATIRAQQTAVEIERLKLATAQAEAEAKRDWLDEMRVRRPGDDEAAQAQYAKDQARALRFARKGMSLAAITARFPGWQESAVCDLLPEQWAEQLGPPKPGRIVDTSKLTAAQRRALDRQTRAEMGPDDELAQRRAGHEPA